MNRDLQLAVDRAALNRTGSYYQRNPLVGKMRTCPYCRKRSRATETCCNPNYKVFNQATEPRSATAKKRKNPRLTRNRPPLFLVHQRLVELEARPDYKEYEGISGIVEAAIIRDKKAKARVRRMQQRQSRQINRS